MHDRGYGSTGLGRDGRRFGRCGRPPRALRRAASTRLGWTACRPSRYRYAAVSRSYPPRRAARRRSAPLRHRAHGACAGDPGGRLLEEPFLDLSREIAPTIDTDFNERGLFSIAFDPDYADSRRFYLFFSDADGDARIREFRRSPNPDRALKTGEDLLVVEHSLSKQHYGGHLAFGPDQKLYASVGDAKSPLLAQRPRGLYGRLLRLNPRRPSAPVRSRAFGLRDPYRFSFDRLTGDLIATDVGEESWEEINFLPRAHRGSVNFGWPRFEGPPGVRPLAVLGATYRPRWQSAIGSRTQLWEALSYVIVLSKRSMAGMCLRTSVTARSRQFSFAGVARAPVAPG